MSKKKEYSDEKSTQESEMMEGKNESSKALSIKLINFYRLRVRSKLLLCVSNLKTERWSLFHSPTLRSLSQLKMPFISIDNLFSSLQFPSVLYPTRLCFAFMRRFFLASQAPFNCWYAFFSSQNVPSHLLASEFLICVMIFYNRREIKWKCWQWTRWEWRMRKALRATHPHTLELEDCVLNGGRLFILSTHEKSLQLSKQISFSGDR